MFDAEKLYQTDDPALREIAPVSTMAHWRSQGKGPAFLRLGKRVVYKGAHLNEWLETRVVRPGAPAGASAAA